MKRGGDAERIKQSVMRMMRALQVAGQLASTGDPRHACHPPRTCRPRNEPAMRAEGLLPVSLPILTDNVYLCEKRGVHVCSPHDCKRWMENVHGVCPISGMVLGSVYQTDYHEEDPLTWYAKPQLHVAPPDASSADVRLPERNRKRGRDRRRAILGEHEEEEEEEPQTLPNKQSKGGGGSVVPHLSRAEATRRAERLVHTLLYSPKRRVLNQNAARVHQRECAKAKERYLLDCRARKQLPILMHLYEIECHYDSRPLPLYELTFDLDKQQHYVRVIMQMWDRVNRYLISSANDGRDLGIRGNTPENMPKVCFQSVALGTMYAMRVGYAFDGMQLLPRDTFLAHPGHLPLINDLGHFDIPKNRVTNGERIIDACYRSAQRRGVSREALVFRAEDLAAANPANVGEREGYILMPKSRRTRNI